MTFVVARVKLLPVPNNQREWTSQGRVAETIEKARGEIARTANTAIVYADWLTGREVAVGSSAGTSSCARWPAASATSLVAD